MFEKFIEKGGNGVDTPTAMSSVVTALTSILTTDAMFTNLAALIPVVGGVLIFAFTYRIIRKIIKGAQSGKARI